MKSVQPGRNISAAEVVDIAPAGIWMLVDDREFLLSYEQFPWFRNAPVAAVFRLERPSPDHLYWPDLDVDLHVTSLEHPEQFPLVAKDRRLTTA